MQNLERALIRAGVLAELTANGSARRARTAAGGVASRLLLTVVVLWCSAGHAAAQASPRAARILSLGADVPAVMIAPDQAWFAAPNDTPLSVCAGDRCAPVRDVEACTPPRCPGAGSVLRLERAIADVPGFPTDREGFRREVDALRQDPALAAIAWSYGSHPEPPPGPPQPAWFSLDGQRGLRWELDAVALAGVVGSSGVALVGGEISGGFRFVWEARNEDDEFLMVLFGNVMGADLRVRTFASMPAQSPSTWAVSIGVAPSMGVAPEHESFRLPSVYASLMPEMGVIVSEDRAPAWYAGWTLPVTYLLDPHLGLEGRATVLVIDDWQPGDDVEALVTFSVGLVAR